MTKVPRARAWPLPDRVSAVPSWSGSSSSFGKIIAGAIGGVLLIGGLGALVLSLLAEATDPLWRHGVFHAVKAA